MLLQATESDEVLQWYCQQSLKCLHYNENAPRRHILFIYLFCAASLLDAVAVLYALFSDSAMTLFLKENAVFTDHNDVTKPFQTFPPVVAQLLL